MLLVGAALASRTWRRPAVRVVVGWLAIGALPAALGWPAPHPVRSIAMLPAWYLLAAIGTGVVWRWLQRRGFAGDWALALVLSVGLHLYGYHRYYGHEQDGARSSGWLEGFRVAQAEVDRGRFAHVVIPADLPVPRVGYIYGLFATAYSPREYLAQGGRRADPAWPDHPERGPLRFRPYVLRVVDWETEVRRADTLYVRRPGQALPAGARVVAEMKGIGGRDAMRLVAFDVEN